MLDFLKGVWVVFVVVAVVVLARMKEENRERAAKQGEEMLKFVERRQAQEKLLADFREEERKRAEFTRILQDYRREPWRSIRLEEIIASAPRPVAPMPRAKPEIAPTPRAK